MYKFQTFTDKETKRYNKLYEYYHKEKDIDIYPNIISECNGISNYLKNFPNFLIDKFNKSDKVVITDLYFNDIKIKRLLISFTEKQSFFKSTNYSFDQNKVLYNCNINIKISDINTMKESISHELNHLIRFYKINVDKHIIINSKCDKIKKSFNNVLVSNYQKNNIDLSKYISNLGDFMYLSLDDELNARISELYTLLRNNNKTNNKEDLLKIFHNGKIYNDLIFIKDYKLNNIDNNEMFIHFVKDFKFCLELLNIFFTKSGYKILTIDNAIFYINKYIEYSKEKSKKHLKKCFDIINELSDDLSFLRKESLNDNLFYLMFFN